jgi:hypothetical protein
MGFSGSDELALYSPGQPSPGNRNQPVVGEELWVPGEQLEAHCIPRVINKYILQEPHISPSRLCKCGIFGHKSKEILSTWIAYCSFLFPWESGICGEVALWGHFEEGELGWRAQYGYPQKLYGMNCVYCGSSGEIRPFKEINLYLHNGGLRAYCTSCVNENTPDRPRIFLNGREAAHQLANRYAIEIVN